MEHVLWFHDLNRFAGVLPLAFPVNGLMEDVSRLVGGLGTLKRIVLTRVLLMSPTDIGIVGALHMSHLCVVAGLGNNTACLVE